MMYNFKLGSTLNSIIPLKFFGQPNFPHIFGFSGVFKNVLLLAIRKHGFALVTLRVSKSGMWKPLYDQGKIRIWVCELTVYWEENRKVLLKQMITAYI